MLRARMWLPRGGCALRAPAAACLSPPVPQLLRPGSAAAGGCCSRRRFVHIEARLAELGIDLPEPPAPKGTYVFCVRSGSQAHVVSIPVLPQGGLMLGTVGKDLTLEDGHEAARLAAVNMLSTLKAELGDLDRIVRMVKITGYVKCVDDYDSLTGVLNGFSDFIGEALGPEKAVHARAAVGVNALPLNLCVEFEAVVEVD